MAFSKWYQLSEDSCKVIWKKYVHFTQWWQYPWCIFTDTLIQHAELNLCMLWTYELDILWYVMLQYVTKCYVMLCYVMLCYVMLCYVMLCYVMLSCSKCYVMACWRCSQATPMQVRTWWPTTCHGPSVPGAFVSTRGRGTTPFHCASMCWAAMCNHTSPFKGDCGSLVLWLLKPGSAATKTRHPIPEIRRFPLF